MCLHPGAWQRMWKSRLISSSSTSLSSTFPATLEWKTSTGNRSLSLPTPHQPSPYLVLVASWKAGTITRTIFFLKGEATWSQGVVVGVIAFWHKGTRRIREELLVFSHEQIGPFFFFFWRPHWWWLSTIPATGYQGSPHLLSLANDYLRF